MHFARSKLLNWQKMSEKQKNKESPTNLELVRNIHTKGVNRSTHRGRWCNQWAWVERQILCDNDSNSWFIFLNSWKLRKSLQKKGCTRQARNRWNRYSWDASGEISTPPGQFQIGKLGCTVAFKNIFKLIVFEGLLNLLSSFLIFKMNFRNVDARFCIYFISVIFWCWPPWR